VVAESGRIPYRPAPVQMGRLGPCHTARMDRRPPVWIGHAVLPVNDVNLSADFWRDLGMREIERNEHVAVLELRGGTHLILVPGNVPDDVDAPFDLMVEDLDATHAEWEARGLDPSPIESRQFHTSFTVRDLNGYRLKVNSSHVVGDV
jgi:catechol 2,3-dioxygenase-like lactoylglutathione lyase family enzyme